MSLVKSLQNAKDMEDVRDILSTQWNKINRKDEVSSTFANLSSFPALIQFRLISLP